MSGRYSRNKGYRAENELVHIFTDAGIPIKRVPLSGAMKSFQGGDLLEPNGQVYEVKIRNKINDTFYEITSNNTIGLIRGDKKPWLIVMKLEDYFKIIKKLRELEICQKGVTIQ